MHTIEFSTHQPLELVNITSKVQKIIPENFNGIAILFAPHATGTLLIAENEAGLKKDILNKVRDLFPPGAGYAHDRIDDNAHSHLTSSFIGCHLCIPIRNGHLQLGTWQSIFFLETDGPRPQRHVHVCLICESSP